MSESNLVNFDEPIVLTENEMKHLIPGYLTVFREMGMRTLRTGNTREALKKFHAAAAAYPDDVRTILGRGQCRYQIKLLTQAQSDAEQVLQMNDHNKDAILLQARCEYELGNAEEALLMFRRGANKRGKRREFKEGAQAVLATLEFCVGRHSGSALVNFHPTIHAMIEKERRIAQIIKENKKNDCLDEPEPIYNCSDEAWRKLQLKWKHRDAKIAFTYLGNLGNELEFNRGLLSDTDPRIRTVSEQIFCETDNLLAILRARRPLYHMQHKYRTCHSIISRQNARLLEKRLADLDRSAKRMIENIEKFLEEGWFKECVDEGYRLKCLLETFPPSAERQQVGYLNKLCERMGDVYFRLKLLPKNLSKEDCITRIQYVLGLNQAFNELTFDWLTDVSPFPFFDAKRWIKTFKGFIDTSESDLERSWMHLELSRAYGVLKKWPHAAAEARKAANYAERCGHDVWLVNALFTIMCCESRRSDGEIWETLNECHALGLKIKNEGFLQVLDFIKYVLSNREERKMYDAATANAKREIEILRLMDGEEKIRMRDLFARMRAVRGDRRFNLIPSLAIGGDKTKGTLSIIAGGTGGRLGLHPIAKQSFYEFIGVPDPFKTE